MTLILRTLTLNNGTEFEVTGDTWASFGEAYRRSEEPEDYHGIFAELLDVDRSTAKEVVFRMLYTNVLTEPLMKLNKGV